MNRAEFIRIMEHYDDMLWSWLQHRRGYFDHSLRRMIDFNQKEAACRSFEQLTNRNLLFEDFAEYALNKSDDKRFKKALIHILDTKKRSLAKYN